MLEIKKVETKKELKQFIDFNYELYEGNPYYVPSLYEDELGTLTKDKNPAFDFCEAEYFLALRDGKIVGRVAAIINHKANKRWDRSDVRFGWIDFIDDREVSRALLKAVEDYGRSKGMKQIVGPLGFTDMDKEGLLTWGFDQLSTMATSYNHEYYQHHIEAIPGYEVDNRYVEYKIMVPEEVPAKLAKLSQMIEKRYNLHVRKVKRSEIMGKEQFGRKLFEIINETYKDLYGYSEMTERQIDHLVSSYMPVLDPEFLSFIEDWNTPEHKVIGAGITVPSIAVALQKCRKGRLLPFGWWHVIRALKFHKTEGVDLLLVGILPEYRSKGANALLFADLIPIYIKYGIKWGESQVEMETNKGVQGQWDFFDTTHHKSRICYKKMI